MSDEESSKGQEGAVAGETAADATPADRKESWQQIHSYLDELSTALEEKRTYAKQTKVVAAFMVVVGLVMTLSLSKRVIGVEWWIALGPLLVFGYLMGRLGNWIGGRIWRKEFGAHEEFVKELGRKFQEMRRRHEEDSEATTRDNE